MNSIDEVLEKYSEKVISQLDKSNISKIVLFLHKENCDYIEDLLEDYLDLFIIPYEVFVEKYKELNNKYHNEYLKLASQNMNLLEEFFND